MTGLKINTAAKTTMMRGNSPTSGKVRVDGRELEEVLKFVYLGGTGRRHQKSAWKGQSSFRPAQKHTEEQPAETQHQTEDPQVKRYSSSVLLYGCETWRMTKGDEIKLDVFLHI